MNNYTRVNHFDYRIRSGYDIFAGSLHLNGYISNATIKDFMIYLFIKISDSFNEYSRKQRHNRTSFLNYDYIITKMVHYIMDMSILSETNNIIKAENIIGEKYHYSEFLWELMKIDDRMNVWIYDFLLSDMKGKIPSS
jgi:hypothetical protein